jgi:hypothetical protein
MTACRPGWTAGRERWRRPAATQDYTNFIALPICVIFVLHCLILCLAALKMYYLNKGTLEDRLIVRGIFKGCGSGSRRSVNKWLPGSRYVTQNIVDLRIQIQKKYKLIHKSKACQI